MTPSIAFVTVSYGPDRDRCELLCESIDSLAPSLDHWIVVDRADLPAFRSLEASRRSVLTTEDVLPVWLRRLDTRRLGLRSNVWIQLRGKPVRGWLVQQLVKLAIANELGADVLMHTDSDVTLMRPFGLSSVVDEGGRVRLVGRPNAIDEGLPNHVRWHRAAERLLGLPPAPLPLCDFITSLVPWKRENAVALLDHVERRTGRPWPRALAQAWDVSEYILYGRFVTDVLGDAAGQYVTPASLCRDYWTPVPLTPPEVEALLDGMERDEVAVSITAKARMAPESYGPQLRRRWATATLPREA